jgi:hypothetical protein
MWKIEAARQAREIAGPVAVGIHKTADQKAVDDRILVPKVIYQSRSRDPECGPANAWQSVFTPTGRRKELASRNGGRR